MKNVHKYEKQIVKHGRKALGYEDTMAFNYGYISALLTNELISRKEYNVLVKVYTEKNEGYDFFFIDRDGKVSDKYEDK